MQKHKKAINRHTKQNAFERFDVLLSNHDLVDWVKKIKSNNAELVFHQSNTRSIYFVEIKKGVKVKVVYSHKQEKIITVLDKTCLGHPNSTAVRKTVNAILKDL